MHCTLLDKLNFCSHLQFSIRSIKYNNLFLQFTLDTMKMDRSQVKVIITRNSFIFFFSSKHYTVSLVGVALLDHLILPTYNLTSAIS